MQRDDHSNAQVSSLRVHPPHNVTRTMTENVLCSGPVGVTSSERACSAGFFDKVMRNPMKHFFVLCINKEYEQRKYEEVGCFP